MNWDHLVFALVIVKSDTIGCRGRHHLGASGSGRQSRGGQISSLSSVETPPVLSLVAPKYRKVTATARSPYLAQ